MTETPEVTKPDAVFVLQAEANSTPFVFDWQGKTYTIPHVRDMDTFRVQDTIAMLGDEGAVVLALFEQGMSPKEWAALRKAGLTQATFRKLIEAWREHCGIGTGESSASSD